MSLPQQKHVYLGDGRWGTVWETDSTPLPGTGNGFFYTSIPQPRHMQPFSCPTPYNPYAGQIAQAHVQYSAPPAVIGFGIRF